jgi:hypothetical protein
VQFAPLLVFGQLDDSIADPFLSAICVAHIMPAGATRVRGTEVISTTRIQGWGFKVAKYCAAAAVSLSVIDSALAIMKIGGVGLDRSSCVRRS